MHERQKQKAAEKATHYVKNNMTIGLGSGSTMAVFVKLLGNKGINAKFIPSSRQIEKEARKNKLKIIKKAGKIGKIDVAVDGADQIAGKNLLKGMGAYAFAREKEIDYKAKKCIIIADSSKKRKKLASPILVAIKPGKKNKMTERLKKFGKLVITSKRDDSGNIMAKLYAKINNPKKLEKQLDKIAPNGIFANFKRKPLIIIGK